MSKAECSAPLNIPFTPEGMVMVTAILEGMARVVDAQAEQIKELDDRMGFRP